MAVDPRRFNADPIAGLAGYARDTRRDLDDTAATLLARLGALRLTRVVLATSEVTTPYAGQLIVNATDNMLYEYNGSAWVGVLAMGGSSATQRHEARYESTTVQAIGNATDTKVRFPTAVTTCDDVTPSGTGNQDFLLNRAGLWRISASQRLAATGADDTTLFLSTGTNIATLTARFAMQIASIDGTSEPSMSVSTDIRVTASTSVFAGVFQNSGVSLNTHTGFGATNHIALTWLRP